VLPAGSEALVCLACGAAAGPGALRLGPAVVELLLRIGRQPLPRVAPPPEPAALRQVEELCARVRRHFLQRELRSYEVIQKTRSVL
jgi:hypothetical protein